MNIDRLLKQGNKKVTFTRTTQARVLSEWHMLKHAEHLLGVPLITLLKAFKQGVWSKGGFYEPFSPDNIPHYIEPEELRLGIYYPCRSYSVVEHQEMCLFEMHFESPVYVVALKDYGKTWALKKEELQ